MSSNGPHAYETQEQKGSISFEELEIGLTEITPKKFHIASGIHIESGNEYTVNDIVESNREGVDITDQIRRLDKSQASRRVSTESLFPRISDDFLDNVEYNDSHQSDDDNRSKASDVPGRELRGDKNSDDLSELTRRYAQQSTPQRRQKESLKRSSVKGSFITNNANQYYQNALRVYRKSGSVEMNGNVEDIEIGRNERDSDTKDVDQSYEAKHPRGLKLHRRIKADLEYFNKHFLETHKKLLFKRFKMVIIYIMLPSLITAFLLFYAFGNPPDGVALVPCDQVEGSVKTANELGANNDVLKVSGRRSLIGYFTGQFEDENSIGFQSPSQVPSIATDGTPAPTISPTRKPTFDISEKADPSTCFSQEKSLRKASVSWWFLFIGVRQVYTFCLAVLIQLLFIDFFVFRTRFFPKLVGTNMALAMGQSKGWPCIVLFWALSDMILLFGDRPFSRHWLCFQNAIDLMNEYNPSGNIPDHPLYKRIIYFALSLSVAATLKRIIMAKLVGRRVVVNYKQDLSELIKKLLVIGDVTELSDNTSDFPVGAKSIFQRMTSVGREVVDQLDHCDQDFENMDETVLNPEELKPIVQLVGRPSMITSTMLNQHSSTFMNTIYDLLDEWEEPELQNEYLPFSTKEILHFRRAIEFISSDYPFSAKFGKATTREQCARASQDLFERLLERRKTVLDFHILCKVAENTDGTHDKKKLLELVRLFQPNRDGEITKLEFVKSIDSVYKQLRILLVNINSASQIDRAYGQITDVCFYVLAIIIGIALLQFDVSTVILGISSLLVTFAFMLGPASSKYVEGVLMILVRRPYDIGDKVCFMDANADVDDYGPPSGGWIVENVDLYTTTVRLGTTREYATFTNGSLANSRILNLKRSEKPNIYMYLKFTMNITQEQLDEFRRRMVKYIKDRPREWIKLVSLRCTDFETEQQYLKFSIIIQHREPWQSYGTIQVSKSGVYIHALHLTKELKMDYVAPKLPVQLTGNPSKLLTRNILGETRDTQPLSQLPFGDSKLSVARNEPMPSETIHTSQDDQIRPNEVSSTQFNAEVASAIDGSLFRRKGTHRTSTNKSQVPSEEDFEDKQLHDVVGSTINRSQVTFAEELHPKHGKRKDI